MRLVSLTPDYPLTDFDCGDDDLNRFLLDDAKPSQELRIANTFILEADDGRIAAYFCLLSDKVSKDEVIGSRWKKVRSRFPKGKRTAALPFSLKPLCRNLRVQICALAPAQFQILFALVEQYFDAPADLVFFEGLYEIQTHVGGYHHLILRAFSVADDKELYRDAPILSADTFIGAPVLPARPESALTLSLRYQNLG